VKRVVNGTKSGSIVLFHNDLENTTEALPTIIAELKDKGFDFSTVSELIHWENYTIDNSGKQVLTAEAQIHVAGTQINAAFETLLENLTIDEIMSLENGLTPALAARLSALLTPEQVRAITAMSDEEMSAAWAMLVEAKATSGQLPPLQRADDDETDDMGGKPTNPPQNTPDTTDDNETQETHTATDVHDTRQADEDTGEIEDDVESDIENNTEDDTNGEPPLLNEDKY
jgi:hypothetical protein